MPLSADARAEIDRRLKQKRFEVAQKLAAVLAGQEGELRDMKLPKDEDPSEPPAERLRRFMRLLADLHARIDAEDFGRCVHCQRALSELELRETPWADCCRACA